MSHAEANCDREGVRGEGDDEAHGGSQGPQGAEVDRFRPLRPVPGPRVHRELQAPEGPADQQRRARDRAQARLRGRHQRRRCVHAQPPVVRPQGVGGRKHRLAVRDGEGRRQALDEPHNAATEKGSITAPFFCAFKLLSQKNLLQTLRNCFCQNPLSSAWRG